jgi:hypothetical protein
VRVFYIAKLVEMRDGELDLMPDRETLSKLEWQRLGRRFEELQEFGVYQPSAESTIIF